MYIFKDIKPVSSSNELIDIILSKTQRKTPTEVHPGYQISRIRGFYMRKIKFCAESFTEKLTDIVNSFPKIEEIHPFFADIINILYDKDHYKIALSQVNVVNGIISNIAKDYVKFLKYGDSLYRCKTLKIAAFGRMCTAVKKIKPSLTYLEEVRRHLGRLPNIDAFAPTVLVFGFPNVGKSSFLNVVSNANVEVSSMPFSTQNLFVGHCLHNNVKIQFIDSPGVLKRAIEDRNTIEMQSLTALAHLRTAVLFMIDVSETSGYTIAEQIELYKSLKPLYEKKPLLVALSKIDLLDGNLEFASDSDSSDLIEKRNLLQRFKEEEGDYLEIHQFSNNETEQVQDIKLNICEKLLKFRLDQRKQTDGRKLKTDEDYLMGVKVQKPTIIRNSIQVRANIPQSVIDMRNNRNNTQQEEFKLEQWKEDKIKNNKSGKFLNLPVKKRATLKDVAEEMGGAGVFNFPLQEHFMLDKEEWKYDKVPEIWNGINIIDYVDPDIEQKLAELEREEEERLKLMAESRDWQAEAQAEHEWNQGQELLKQINEEKHKVKLDRKINGNKRRVTKDQMLDQLRQKLDDQNKNTSVIMKKIQNNKRNKQMKKRIQNPNAIEEEGDDNNSRVYRSRSHNRSVSQRDKLNRKEYKGEKLKRRIQKKVFKAGLKGDGDRGYYDKKPKHLFAGKSGNGTSDYR
jgi:nucleolar GTP-binding protein